MKKVGLFFLITVVINLKNANAQISNRSLFPTPNASAIQQYGQVPVNYFNGLPSIDVPITDFKSGELTIPVSISYHAGSIKPGDKSSWVGQSWSLNAGGVISRVINDLPDEFINFRKAYSEASNSVPHYQAIENNKYGYFYNYSHLNGSDWITTKLQTEYQTLFPNQVVLNQQQYEALVNRKDKAADEFSFNFLGISGSMFLGNDGIWKFKTKADVGNFNVEVVTGPYIVQDPRCTSSGSTVYNCLTKFILTASDGTKYFFGADTMVNFSATKRRYGLPTGVFTQNWGLTKKNFFSDDSTAIEFSRVGVGGGDAFQGRDGGTVPMSWYLTKIKAIGGDSITLNYSRDGFQITNRTYGQAYQYNCATCSPTTGSGNTNFGSANNLVIQDGVSLSVIKGVNGRIEFKKSKANVLDYRLMDDGIIPNSNIDLFCAYAFELFNSTGCGYSQAVYQRSNFVKLDSICIKTGSEKLSSFAFKYTEDVNNRLFLDTLKAINSNNTILNSTVFKYHNPEKLKYVNYETRKVDHWGFYNGIDPICNYFSSPSTCSGSFNWTDLYNPANPSYKNSRTPNSDSMRLGILTEILYPTGGKTQFVWEPNTYSKIINHDTSANSLAINVFDKGNSIIGAGLRIKQINSFANPSTTALTKNYFYQRNYLAPINSLSSGVLNGSEPNYIENYQQPGQFSYSVWTSASQSPMSLTNGNYITYSNVVEQNIDNSIKEFTFSNHDNGYKDRAPTSWIFYAYKNFSYQNFVANSMELERGMLLKESIYKNGSLLLQRKSFGYNNSPTRFTNSVRNYVVDNKFSLAGSLSFGAAGEVLPYGVSPGNPVFQGSNLFGLESYTYQPFLRTDTIDKFDENGLNPMRVINNYTYDNYRNKKSEILLNSKSENLETSYSYCYDSIVGLSPTGQQGKSAMQIANMTGIVLEKKQKQNNFDIQKTRKEYAVKVTNTTNSILTNITNWILPNKALQSLGLNPLEIKSENINYSNLGRLLMYKNIDQIPVSLDWGYNQEYPTVKIINAENSLKSTTTYNPIVQLYSTNVYASGTISNIPNQTFSTNINHNSAGDIIFKIQGSGVPYGNGTLTFTCNLSGPVSKSWIKCFGNYNSYCSSSSSNDSIVFENLPAGLYNLSGSLSTSFTAFTLGVNFKCSNQINPNQIVSGIKEFFYDGFEENTNANVLSGTARCGRKYYNTNYTTNFTAPTARNYIIQWWNLVAGQWKFNEQPFTGNMVLTGPVDEIRIFPSNAFMTSYTYSPLVGMSSETDPNGYSKYYEYDNFNRLSLIRDQDNNIVKKICYNYTGQVEDCPLINSTTPRWVATGNTRCQPCPANNLYNNGIREREEKDINPNSPTYTSLPRWVIDPTGTCPSPQNWVATGITRCQPCAANPTYNSGVREKEEKDMNPCSTAGTGNTTRWVIDPTGTCPSPADYQLSGVQYCQQVGNVNTGSLVKETIDINPCSGTVGQAGPPIIVTNHAPCAPPIPCVPACASPQYQCINGVCVQGFLKVVKVRRISKLLWECTSAYCFYNNAGTINDNLYIIGPSTYTEITTGSTPCTVECF
jgi:hypothetical protein